MNNEHSLIILFCENHFARKAETCVEATSGSVDLSLLNQIEIRPTDLEKMKMLKSL